MKNHNPRPLRLITGGLDYECTIGTTRIAIVPLDAPAPTVDVVVVEQDTHCLLAVDSHIKEPQESLPALNHQLACFVPYRTGEVVVRQDEPLQLQAIVHDLDQTPSWREEWIAAAIEGVLDIVSWRQLQHLGIPALGTIHGRFPVVRFLELLLEALKKREEGPQQIWIGIVREECADAINHLKTLCPH